MLWRLGRANERDICARERSERIALRLVGISFLLLAAYVAGDASWSLYKREAPEQSALGIAITALSLVVMPILAHAKRKVARGLNSGALEADSRQTDICAYLSAIVLGGLLLNAALGWWWADAGAAHCIIALGGSAAGVPPLASEGPLRLRATAGVERKLCRASPGMLFDRPSTEGRPESQATHS